MKKFSYNKLSIKDILHKGSSLYITLGIIIIAVIVLYSYLLSIDKKSRDETRYANLISISDQLKIYYEKNKSYPMPEDAVNITASGEILTYQGYLGDKVFAELGIEPIKDPVGDKIFKYLNYYTYAIDKDKQHFQLMAFFEKDKDTDYAPVKRKVPFGYGDKVGIAIEDETVRPIQETKKGLDILNEKKFYSIYNGKKNILKGDDSNLKMFIANTQSSMAKSCLEIKSSGWNENGYYWINPLIESTGSTLQESFKVYCDMENDGGGWARLYYKNGAETCYNDGINYSSGMVENIFTKDFAVSDNLETLKSEGSWIINNINFDNENFDFEKMTNIVNCKTPTGDNWKSDYTGGFLNIQGTLNTLGTWNEMFYGCHSHHVVGDNTVLRIGGFINKDGVIHKGEFIHGNCNDYTGKDYSITSRWDWNNTRVIWVR